ncbi:MAG TPA: PIG-L family deacetylase [Jatrophihabitans sp.]|nr:PIG-L family deacetylase [Jatrophihabitans sp.]
MSAPAEADRSIVGAGTTEAEWAGWAGWSSPARSVAELVPSRLVVIAPHPDDETLMAGGLMHDAVRAGLPVLVIAVTQGDASHPGSARWPVPVLRAQRRFERARALASLGARDVLELGVGDGLVQRECAAVAGMIRTALQPADTVVTTWRFDGHPDHEATAAAACAARPDRLLEAPVWGWHWARPDQLPADAIRYPLAAATRAAKVRAIAAFGSQLEADPSTGADPILPDWALPRWQRPCEVYFNAC